MEASASAHHWGQALQELGHEVRLIPPGSGRPFIKTHKNDAADTEASYEARARFMSLSRVI